MTVDRGIRVNLRLLLFLAGEAAWLLVVASVLADWLDSPGSVPILEGWAIGLTLLISASLTQLVSRHGDPGRFARYVVVAIGLVFAVGLATVTRVGWGLEVAPAPLSALLNGRNGVRWVGGVFLVLVGWWRGVAAGRSQLDLNTVSGAFRTSMTVLGVMLFLDALGPASTRIAAERYVLPTIVAIGAGLIGMPLARLNQLAIRSRSADGPRIQVSRQWFGLLLATVGSLLVVTILLGLILTFDRLDRVIGAIASVIGAIAGLVVTIIATPIGFLIQLLVEYIIAHRPPPHDQPNPLAGIRATGTIQKQAVAVNPDLQAVLTILTWALVAAVVILLLWLVARAVTRSLARERVEDVDETRDSVWSWSEAMAVARAWLRSWWRREAGNAPEEDIAGIDLIAPGPPRTMREVYRQFLVFGSLQGRRRVLTETPLDYQRALAPLLPFTEHLIDLETITDKYDQERYGDVLTDPAEIARAIQALERLRGMGEFTRPNKTR